MRFALLVGLVVASLLLKSPVAATAADDEAYDVGNRLELFLDRFFVDSLKNVRHVLHEPRDEGQVLGRDEAWEDKQPSFVFGSILRDGDRFRMYYRGNHAGGEITCLAESTDGRNWTKPKLGLIERAGSRDNNIVLDDPLITHNFAPFLDENPAASPEQRYKAIAGIRATRRPTRTSPARELWSRPTAYVGSYCRSSPS
ncbi:MAG: hypothetical protein QM775_08335 [Pirellulales bacterium]